MGRIHGCVVFSFRKTYLVDSFYFRLFLGGAFVATIIWSCWYCSIRPTRKWVILKLIAKGPV